MGGQKFPPTLVCRGLKLLTKTYGRYVSSFLAITLIKTYKMVVCMSPSPCGGAKGPKTEPKGTKMVWLPLDPTQTEIMMTEGHINRVIFINKKYMYKKLSFFHCIIEIYSCFYILSFNFTVFS